MNKENISEGAVIYVLKRKDEELRDLKMGEIAGALGVDESFLSKQFEKERKITLSEFILREIMYRAVYILKKEREISVEDIAKKFRYPAVEDFVREFEKYFLVKPGRYRELKLKVKET